MGEGPHACDYDGQNAQNSEPVPEDVYGSWSPAPSPDGKYVAFISDRSGEPAVWIEGPASRQLAKLPIALPRVLTVSWSPDGDWLACVTAATGSTRNEVWLVRPDGADLRLVAGAAPCTAVVAVGSWHGWASDGRLMVTESDAVAASALLIDPLDGARQVITSAALMSLVDFVPDGAAGGRALVRIGPRGYRQLRVIDVATGQSRPVDVHPSPAGAPERLGSAERGCLSPDGRTVYVRSDLDRELAALVAVDLTGERLPKVLAERDDAELQDVVLSTDGATLLLLWNIYGGTSAITRLDVASARQQALMPLPRAVVDECRLSPDGRSVLLTGEDWADPRGVWTIDLATATATPLSSRGDGELRGSRGATQSTVEVADLTRPELRRFVSRDGLEVTGWLYRPDTPGPWPTMIHLHGGPEAQERPVYNSLFQSLVTAGIAVLAPNVRGSTGFGRTFLRADDLAGRYGAIEDVAACAAHLLETGVADQHRIGCMGRSYGGYLTLAALVWYPDLFAVGVDICGMADFATFYQHTEPWIAAAATAMYGDPVRDADLLRDLSPIHRIDQLRAPLLVVHGDEDTNVPVEEAEQVVAALAARGVSHKFLLFAGEGHELLATHNRVRFVQETVAWVAEHLDVAASSN